MHEAKQKRTRWLQGSHVYSFLLGACVIIALILYWNSDGCKARKANKILADAYLPNLPASATSLISYHEGVLFGDHYNISFEATLDEIHAWINGKSRALGYSEDVSEKLGITKYELKNFAWGNRSLGSVIVDEKKRRVYVDITYISCSL